LPSCNAPLTDRIRIRWEAWKNSLWTGKDDPISETSGQ
jgi:hypothetical protein